MQHDKKNCDIYLFLLEMGYRIIHINLACTGFKNKTKQNKKKQKKRKKNSNFVIQIPVLMTLLILF